MNIWLAAAVAVVLVGIPTLLIFGVDWRDECEKVGLVKHCVAVGQHDEPTMVLLGFDSNMVPLYMPSTETVTDYACKCEAAGGAR